MIESAHPKEAPYEDQNSSFGRNQQTYPDKAFPGSIWRTEALLRAKYRRYLWPSY
jgi:hypothetical protein